MSADILIINSNILLYNLYATSLTKSLKRKYKDDAKIYWMSSSEINKCLRYNNSIDAFCSKEELKEKEFDIVVNFDFESSLIEEIKSKDKIGIHQPENETLRKILEGNKKTRNNFYQIFFKIAKTSWNGEGINLNYFPKTKQRKNNVGYFIDNKIVEETLSNKVIIQYDNINKIRKCNNFFKQIDHINKYSEVITDNLLISLLATYLNKCVYFLNSLQVNHKIELFNKGKFFKISRKFFYEN
jgi:hypothetical protein